jgi:hypothetical protein
MSSECLDADAILALGHALDWKVEEGLRHLRSCGDCHAQLQILQRTREELLASTPVDLKTLQRISAALQEASRVESDHARGRARLQLAAEACAAGIVALLVLVSNGVPIEGPATASVGFSLGAILMATGNVLAGKLPMFDGHRGNVLPDQGAPL